MNLIDNVSLVSFALMAASSYLIPGVASLLTNVKWPASVTGVISLVLAALSGFVTEAQAPNYDWRHGALLTLTNLGVALIAHKQLWEGDLADRLHRLWPGANVTGLLDMGVGITDELLSHDPNTPGSSTTEPAAPAAAPVDVPATAESAPTADPAAVPAAPTV